MAVVLPDAAWRIRHGSMAGGPSRGRTRGQVTRMHGMGRHGDPLCQLLVISSCRSTESHSVGSDHGGSDPSFVFRDG
eukprot:7254663-Prymnesium_polylepis.1